MDDRKLTYQARRYKPIAILITFPWGTINMCYKKTKDMDKEQLAKELEKIRHLNVVTVLKVQRLMWAIPSKSTTSRSQFHWLLQLGQRPGWKISCERFVFSFSHLAADDILLLNIWKHFLLGSMSERLEQHFRLCDVRLTWVARANPGFSQ